MEIVKDIQEFDPVMISTEDNLFLAEHIGKPTIVALRAANDKVLPAAVKPILDRVNELIELEKHEGVKWIGVDAIKRSIKIWLDTNRKWKLDHQRNKKAPRFPSLYSYDAKGRPHLGGPGSDSGRVRTYFGPAGERIPFAVQLVPDESPAWEAPGFTEAPMPSSGLRVDPDSHRIECRIKLPDGTICGHSESYRVESRSSYNAARARMSKHLRKATENVEEHRELHTNEFST